MYKCGTHGRISSNCTETKSQPYRLYKAVGSRPTMDQHGKNASTSEDFLGATMQSMIITANEPGLAQVWLVSEIVR